MIYLRNLTLSGSCMYFLYWIMSKILLRGSTERQKYFMLKIVLLYYMIPLAPLLNVYKKLLFRIGGADTFQNSVCNTILNMRYTLYRNADGVIYPNRELAIQFIILLCWLIVALVVLTKHLIKQRRMYGEIRTAIRLNQQDVAEVCVLIENLKKEYHILREINLCVLEGAMP